MFSAGLPGRELLKRAEAKSDTVPPVSEVIPAEAEAFPADELLASSTLDTLARTPRQVVATSKGKGTLATTKPLKKKFTHAKGAVSLVEGRGPPAPASKSPRNAGERCKGVARVAWGNGHGNIGSQRGNLTGGERRKVA